VTSYLETKDTGTVSRVLNAAAGSGGLGLSVGALVLRSHELLGVLQTIETTQNVRVISAPSIIATDSIPATMNVGQSVPCSPRRRLSAASRRGYQPVREHRE